jgi:MFS family permease
MRNDAILRLLGNNRRFVAINTILIVNSFIWYLYALNYVQDVINTLNLNILEIMTMHFVSLFLSLILGEYVSRRTKDKMTFLRLWMLTGIFLSLAPLITGVTYWGLVIFSIITGANFGFGIPVSLEYFASTTQASNRGKLGGIIFLLAGIGSFLLFTIGTDSFITASIVLTIWRTMGYLLLKFLEPSGASIITQAEISYRHVFFNRTFMLYLIPWLIFIFINSMSFPINLRVFESNPEIVSYGKNIEFVLAAFSGVIFGFLADSKGRKRLSVVGFAMLGLGYAVLGLTAPNEYGWWAYTIIDGVAWGLFINIFVFSIGGDIAEGKRSGKFHAIVIMPYLLSSFIRLSIGPIFADYVKELGYPTIFSFFSFFLFIAVLPLVLAPETMSEQTLKTNELKNYIEKAKKQANKVQKEYGDKDIDKEAQDGEDHSDEYDKAKALAEKYY